MRKGESAKNIYTPQSGRTKKPSPIPKKNHALPNIKTLKHKVNRSIRRPNSQSKNNTYMVSYTPSPPLFILASCTRNPVENQISHLKTHREKNLPSIPVAKLLAMPPESIADPARFDACPNLSHREKARVFVIVRLRAITGVWS